MIGNRAPSQTSQESLIGEIITDPWQKYLSLQCSLNLFLIHGANHGHLDNYLA